jgi:hypothetical protein
VVEFVQLTTEKCLSAFQLNLTAFFDPTRFENGIVKNWLDVWYVDRLKEKYAAISENTNGNGNGSGCVCNASVTPSMSPSCQCHQLNSIEADSSPSPGSLPSSLSMCSLSNGGCCSSCSSGSYSQLKHSVSSFSLFSPTTTSSWSVSPSFLMSSTTTSSGKFAGDQLKNSVNVNHSLMHTSHCGGGGGDSGLADSTTQDGGESHTVAATNECDQANHLWFCLRDYNCARMEQFVDKLKDYLYISNNRSELILVHTAHPVFEYKDVLAEARRILAMFLSKSSINKSIDELVGKKFPGVAKEHIESLLVKFLNVGKSIRFLRNK